MSPMGRRDPAPLADESAAAVAERGGDLSAWGSGLSMAGASLLAVTVIIAAIYFLVLRAIDLNEQEPLWASPTHVRAAWLEFLIAWVDGG